MKKEWITPQATVDEFTTNEYLNMCSEIACDTKAANHYELTHGLAIHNKADCGNSAHQVIRDEDGDRHFDKMFELKNGKWLPCTLCDENYNPLSEDEIKQIPVGKKIYWTTEYGFMTYHHQGKIKGTAIHRPNHS